MIFYNFKKERWEDTLDDKWFEEMSISDIDCTVSTTLVVVAKSLSVATTLHSSIFWIEDY